MSYQRETISSREAQRPLFVGIDLGGTNTKVGMVDNVGRTLGFESTTTVVSAGPEEAAREMGNVVERLIKSAGVSKSEVAAVGLGAPGPIDVPTGRLVAPVNLPGWHGFDLRDRVSECCGLPVRFCHDACAAVFGEYWLGGHGRTSSVVLFTLGTGLGCGIVVDGVLVEGKHSHGAMVGHIVVDTRDDARVCPCGQRGHLEAYVSGIALVKRGVEMMEEGRKTSLNSRMEHGNALTPLVIAEEAAAGDATAMELVMDAARYLAVGIVNMMHTIDPDVVLVGGGIHFGGAKSALGRQFLERIREEVRRRAFPVPAQRTSIDYATLGSDAGYLGAACLARADYHCGTKAFR
jgi:glucokinase